MSILEQAKAVQAKRKKRYGDADKKRNSKIRRKPTEKNLEVWSRNPGRSDIIGVDGEGTPTLKRDQEPTPRPKRKKAAPKRKKAVKVEPKAEPKPQPKEEPKKGELTGVVEKKKKEESNEVGGFTLRKWVPGSDDSEAYQIYEGEVGNLKLVGLLFKRKADKYERDGFYVRRDPWGYMLYEQGQIIYTSSVYDGFKTKEKAIFGLKNRIGFSMIHRFWENVTNSYKRNAGKARDLRIEAEAYRVLTEKDGARTLSIGYGNWNGTHSMGYLYSKGYVIPIPSGWQIGTPDMKNFDLKKGSKFDKWENPASQVNALNKQGEWWAEKGQGRAVSDLQEIAKQYGMSKSYNFADLGEYQRKRLKDILPISIDEAKVRDEYWEALFNMKGVSNRFRNYWNLFVEIAEDEVPLKNASDAMRDLTYRDYDEAGGRRRKMYLTDISRAETDALQVLLQRNNLGRVSQEQIEFIFKDDGVTAYMYRMRHKLFQLLNNVFAGLSRQASSAYTGGGNFPVARMQKIQDQNEKKERLLLEEIKKYESVLKSYFKGTKYEEKQELEQRRERAEKLGLKAVRKEVDLGVWEYDPGTSRLNFEPAQMLEPDMRTKLRRSPYAMKWSPRFKQYTRVVALDSVPTVGLRNALKRDFDFDLPLPVNAKAAPAPKADNPESIVDNLSAADRSKVSMKIDELAQLADEAKAKGEAAPNYNLCEITIPGTNIYCEGNKGIERAKMPQFKGTPVPGSPAAKLPKDSKGEVDTEPIFRKQLKEEGIAITPKEIYSDNLKATQSELVGAKVAGMTKALEANPNNPGITAPIFVSNDNYVIDGHHRWAAVTSYAIKNGLPKKMKVEVIDLPIEEAIRKSNEFADMIGIAQKAAKTEGESKPKATDRRKKEGGLSARKKRKAERMNAASAAPIDVPKQEKTASKVGSNRFGFTDWGQKAKEHIQAIFDVQDAYKAKLVNLKSTRESIEESYQNFWLQVGFDKALNTDNLIAHLELCDALDVKLRPQYPSLASEQLGLALTKKAGNVLLGSRFKGKLGLVTAEMQTRIDEGKQMRFGTFRNTMTDSGKYDVERLLKALNPITKLYLSNDELRPVMMGVAINMDNEVAMTNAHVLWYGRFQEIDKTIPYFENGIILPNGNLAFDPKSKRYMGIDEQINKEIGFIKGRSAYDPRQIIIIPEENNGSKRGGGMFARPYERIEGLYPNYKAVVPDTMEGNVVMSKEEFVQAYKAFTFMVNYGLTSKNQTGDIKTIVVTFGSGVKTENIFTFDAENLKKLFVTGFFMGSTRYVWEYQDGPGRATVLKYNIDDPMNTESFSLIMPVYMNRETISFSRGPSFAKGGVIDEVEVVDIAPKTGVRIERFRQLREAMTFNGKSAKDFKGKVVVATLKVNGELINVHEFEPSQLQDAYKACILDLAAGVVLMNFSLMDLEPGQNNPQWNKWQPGFHKFQKNTGINLLQAENFRTESSFSQAYATGGIIPRKEEKESYIKQMERFEPQFVVRDTSKAKSEIVDVGDFNPGVDLTVKSASDAGAIFRKFYDPDALRSIEQTFVLYLDKNNKAKYIYFHSQGGQASTVIAATLILNVALQTKCPKFVLAHNHPSGTMIPSAPDKISGKALKKGAEMIGVEMIGSIIISGDINNEKTADVPLDYERGGYIHGPSHAEGGVTMPVGSSGRMVELEGGEGVVNKRSMASQKTITLNGKRMKPCQAVSEINQMDGNGVPITC